MNTLLTLPLLLAPVALFAGTGEQAAPATPAKNIVETAIAAGSFNTLAAALTAADLVNTLKGDGPFTVFAPTDEAFAALPKETLASLLKPENKALLRTILLHHVVAGDVRAASVVDLTGATSLSGQRLTVELGEGVSVGGATVLKTDIACTNGVIHVIDRVILPATEDIVTTAVNNGSFKTLAAALGAAGLVETLQGKGPFTVFAPTDAAFAKLPEGTVASLVKPENKAKLTAILTYHVVPGRVYAKDAVAAEAAATVQGGKLRIAIKNGQLMVNNAKVVMSDIETSNGVIHVIDSVLLPR